MKKIIILLLTIFFTWSVCAHSTKGHTPNGVTIGGKNMDQYMPQFINFFKENLL